MGRPGRETPDKADAYKRAIAVLRRGGSLAEAAKAASVGRDTLWEWRKKDADFAARAEEAMGVGVCVLEDTLTLCAQKALINPAYQKSLIFLLTNRRPNEWRLYRNVAQPSEFKVGFVDPPSPTGSIGIEARKRLLRNRLAELDRKGDNPDCSPEKR